jgi:hypothetical protein
VEYELTAILRSEELIPAELISLQRWIRWKYKIASGKATKMPIMVDGRPASTTSPSTWSNFEEVRKYEQIGFVFCRDDGILGIDLDQVLLSSEKILQWAESIVQESNSYTEYSPSGLGLHIIGFGQKPSWLKSRVDIQEAGLEIYDNARFFTITRKVFQNYSNMREIEAEKVFDFLKPHIIERPKKRCFYRDAWRVNVHEIIFGYKEEQNCKHPFHDSSTGGNFRIDRGGETWRCWRHGVTGNALHLLGQKEGIIECGEAPSKQQWKKIIAVAKERGLIQDCTKALWERISNAQW